MENIENFIDTQLKMLDSEFSERQIRDNVFRYIFGSNVGNVIIDALIGRCMELYAEIMVRYKTSDQTKQKP